MTLRTLAVSLGTAAIVAGGSAPAMAQTTADYPTDTATTAQTAKKHGKHAKTLTDAQLTSIAAALGTDLPTLKAAQAKVKAMVKATTARETKAQEQALLASELGVTAAQVKAAFATATSGRGDCKSKSGTSTTTTDTAAGNYPTDAAA